MTTRRTVLGLITIAGLVRTLRVFAQPQARVPRVGMLALDAGELLEPVREGLRALGYVEGKNIHLEERAAGERYEKLDAIANEFAKLPVDVIVTAGATATRAAVRATSSIPIVTITGSDPVKQGYAASLAKPGGNVTGLFFTGGTELSAKRLELAKELIPRLRRVALLLAAGSAPAALVRADAEKGAKELKLELHVFEVTASNELERTFRNAAHVAQLALVPPSSMFNANQRTIIDLAARHRIPVIYGSTSWVTNGGLISYGSDIVAKW